MYRITVGVDASSAATTAVDWVIAWHRASRAEITLVTAFDYLIAEIDEDAALLERQAARIRAVLPEARVATAMADGSVAGVFERRSSETDVIVVGSHRTRHLRSVLTGRLPLRIAEHSACPVVIVPDDWQPRAGAVVVGVGVGLEVLHAWSRPGSASDVPSGAIDDEQLRAVHGARLMEAARRAREAAPAVRERLHEGSAGLAMVALASDAALAVVGTHPSGPIGELLVGSTAASLIRESRTPVCVVPAEWA